MEDLEDDYEDEEDDDDQDACKCLKCQDKITIRLCYKMFGLTERASKKEVRSRYISLIRENNFLNTIDFNLIQNNIANNNNSTNKSSNSSKLPANSTNSTLTNEESLIKSIINNLTDQPPSSEGTLAGSSSSNTFNIFNESDRLDLITKAYSLIMGNYIIIY